LPVGPENAGLLFARNPQPATRPFRRAGSTARFRLALRSEVSGIFTTSISFLAYAREWLSGEFSRRHRPEGPALSRRSNRSLHHLKFAPRSRAANSRQTNFVAALLSDTPPSEPHSFAPLLVAGSSPRSLQRAPRFGLRGHAPAAKAQDPGLLFWPKARETHWRRLPKATKSPPERRLGRARALRTLQTRSSRASPK